MAWLGWATFLSASQLFDMEPFGNRLLAGLLFGGNGDDAGLKITKDDITLPQDHDGKSTGEAYVQFSSKEDAQKALERHKQEIGHRWDMQR